MAHLLLVAAGFLMANAAWPDATIAAANADLVSERLVASPLEREGHWGLDCAASWAELRLALEQPDPHCVLAPALLESLRLCSYIYQPPGGPENPAECRDFDGVIQLRELSCAGIQALLDVQPACNEGP